MTELTEKEEKLKFLDEICRPRDPKETKQWYVKWAPNYEKDVIFMEYNGPELVVTEFVKLDLSRDIRILDIGTGTGQVGQLLKQNGFKNIDALDATPEMLEFAKQKNCYTNFIQSFVTKDIRLPIEDQTYDVVIMVGCLCPGHIRWNSFAQIARVVKKGGIVFWVAAEPKVFEDKDPDFQNGGNQQIIESLCEQKIWQYIPGFPKKVENYLTGSDGDVYAMKVL